MSPRLKPLLLLVSLAVVVADQWTKHLVEERLPLFDSHEVVPGFLSFTHVRNTGVAFGMLAAGDNGWATLGLTLLGLGALTVIGVYFARTPVDDRALLVSLALILGGAVGNLIDRVFAGAVTDFVDLYVGTYHWHTFNLADSAITVGIVVMAVDALRRRKPEAD